MLFRLPSFFRDLWYTRGMIIKGEEKTKELGRKLAEEAAPGAVYALVGDLGAGKTTLTKAIAEGLGVSEPITSPTFTIVREYDSGRMPLYHFDVYRISDPDEMFELGYEDYFYGDGLCVVEWADLIAEIMPEETRVFRLSYGGEEDERVIEEVPLESLI